MAFGKLIALVSLAALVAVPAMAQRAGRGPGQGPVMTQCKTDIAKYCAGKGHGGATRSCLEAKKADVTAACRTALESTGGGRRQR